METASRQYERPPLRGGLRLLGFVDVDVGPGLEAAVETAGLAGLEADDAALSGENRVVAGAHGVASRVDLRAALADDDRPDLGEGSGVELDAQALGDGIAAKLCRASCFFCSHTGVGFRTARKPRA